MITEITNMLNNYEKERLEDRTTSNPAIKPLYDAIEGAIDVSGLLRAFPNITLHRARGSGNLVKTPLVYFFDKRETNTATDGVYVALIMIADPSHQNYGTFRIALTQGIQKTQKAGLYTTSGLEEFFKESAKAIARQYCFSITSAFAVASGSTALTRYMNIAEKIYDPETTTCATLVDDIRLLLQCYTDYVDSINTLADMEKKFDDAVKESAADAQTIRLGRLANASPKPSTRIVYVTIFDRNPDIVAEVRFQAKGMCGRCGSDAPFNRRSDGTPYLEVHHKKKLSAGGDDTVANAIALCPNCHREEHYG